MPYRMAYTLWAILYGIGIIYPDDLKCDNNPDSNP